MMAMELTSDSVEEILSWVPARSLARLRYTCKKWETLIADPRFANKHLSRMRGREQELRVFIDIPNSESYLLGSTVSCVGIDFNELKKPSLDLQVFKPVSSPNLYVRHLFHCDGLLLFVTPSRVLVLNPLLKQARWVDCDYGFDHDVDTYGLGYISNQSSSSPYVYKIVRFRCGDGKDTKTQVYDFKYENWKTVVDKTFNGFLELPLSSVCLRGTPYWIGYYKNKIGDKIFSMWSFDFSKERFEAFSLPVSIKPDDDSLWLWIFRGDQLSLVHESNSKLKLRVWVMKKNEKHFTDFMTLDVSRCSMFPRYSSYFIENNGELVLCTHHLDGRSISIHIEGDGEECQKFEYNSDMDRTIDGCSYVPSLIQVPGFPRQEEEDSTSRSSTE